MSQNAETTAADTTELATPVAAKKPLSADAFRALTLKLKQPAAQPAPQTPAQPTPQMPIQAEQVVAQPEMTPVVQPVVSAQPTAPAESAPLEPAQAAPAQVESVKIDGAPSEFVQTEAFEDIAATVDNPAEAVNEAAPAPISSTPEPLQAQQPPLEQQAEEQLRQESAFVVADPNAAEEFDSLQSGQSVPEQCVQAPPFEAPANDFPAADIQFAQAAPEGIAGQTIEQQPAAADAMAPAADAFKADAVQVAAAEPAPAQPAAAPVKAVDVPNIPDLDELLRQAEAESSSNAPIAAQPKKTIAATPAPGASGSTPQARTPVAEIENTAAVHNSTADIELMDISTPEAMPGDDPVVATETTPTGEPAVALTEEPVSKDAVIETAATENYAVAAPVDSTLNAEAAENIVPNADRPVDADGAPNPAQDIAQDQAAQDHVDPLAAAMQLIEASGLEMPTVSDPIDHIRTFPQKTSLAIEETPDQDLPPAETKTPGKEAADDASALAQIAAKAAEVPKIQQTAEPALEPDEEAGKTARLLLDMMSAPSGASQPQERALAADTLLQLLPRMPVRDLVALSERVCMMEEPPALLVEKLINHSEARVAQPLLEGATTIGEQDLLKLVAVCDVDRLVMIAKRRSVTSGLGDALIGRGEPSVYLTLVRNPGAKLSHDAFVLLCDVAKTQSSLQAPLATRGDTPPPIAFELFWSLPIELRRYILSRFLTDSSTLDKILKIAQSVDGSKSTKKSGEPNFPPKRKTEELAKLIADGADEAATRMLAELAGIGRENAARIIADPDGEPLTVAFKMLGMSRQLFNEAIKNCINSSKAMLRSDRNVAELQAMFDSLSFNKARTLLTYWDWAMEKTGPYTRHLM